VEIDALNDPCALLWGEVACYMVTGDADRLRRILPAQKRWYEAFSIYLRDTNGLFITDWASADNHPRNLRLGYGVDVACQVVLFARLLSRVCRICRDPQARGYDCEAGQLSRLIRRLMWNEERGFYFDLDRKGKRMEIVSILGFWPLLSGVATLRQARALVRHLRDTREFDRPVMVPTLSASEPTYAPTGSYYLGGVWPFTNTMIIEGLEAYSLPAEAHRIAMNFWEASIDVFRETGTFWEYLQPEAREPGRTIGEDGWNSRPDFTGWGAWGPISLLIEHAIGLRVNAPENRVVWNITSTSRCGCLGLAFGGVVTDLVAEPRGDKTVQPRITARTNQPYLLEVHWGAGKSDTLQVK
jgi:hypothetical protein